MPTPDSPPGGSRTRSGKYDGKNGGVEYFDDMVEYVDKLVGRVDGEPRALTGYQFDLLRVLAENAGRVMTRDALMNQLRGHALEAFDRSIDVHVSRVRAAIEDDPRQPRRVLTVRGTGYVFAQSQDEDDA